MSKRGYSLEHEVEGFFLELAGQSNKDSMFKPDGSLGRTIRVSNSGAENKIKGDVRTMVPWLKTQFMVECKEHRQRNKKQGIVYRLPIDQLNKVMDEAKVEGVMGLFAFSFKGGKTAENSSRVWFVIFCEDYEKTFGPSILDISKKVVVNEGNKKSLTCVKDDFDNELKEGYKAVMLSPTNKMYMCLPAFYFKKLIMDLKEKKQDDNRSIL